MSSTYSAPGDHYVVQIEDIETARGIDPVTKRISGPQPLYLWADVCGQWRFLTDLFAPDQNPLLTPTGGTTLDHDRVSLDGFQGARFDVYLDDLDSLRVFVGGYAQRDMDGLYGDAPSGTPLYNMNAYDAGLEAAETVVFGTGDNQNLGGAVYEARADTAVNESPVKIPAQSSGVTGYLGGTIPDPVMKVRFRVTPVPRPPQILTSTDQLNFGTTCTGSSTSLQLQISNAQTAQSALVVNNFSLTGSGFSLVSPPALPLTLAPGASRTLTVRFSPTASGAGDGLVVIGSNDPQTPQLPVTLSGSVGFPTIRATANTNRTPTLTFSRTRTLSASTTTWSVAISNPGDCILRVSPSIAGTGGTWKFVLPSSYYNPFTGGLLRDIVVAPGTVNTDLQVMFTATQSTFKAVGTLTLTSNDPLNPTTTLVFGAEGVPIGMRVLIVDGDGTPYPAVDQIKLKSNKAKANTHLKDVPLTTIDPPASWKRIQFHYMTALDPAEDGSDYTLEVQAGNKKQKLNFTLTPDEFQQLTVTLP